MSRASTSEKGDPEIMPHPLAGGSRYQAPPSTIQRGLSIVLAGASPTQPLTVLAADTTWSAIARLPDAPKSWTLPPAYAAPFLLIQRAGDMHAAIKIAKKVEADWRAQLPRRRESEVHWIADTAASPSAVEILQAHLSRDPARQVFCYSVDGSSADPLGATPEPVNLTPSNAQRLGARTLISFFDTRVSKDRKPAISAAGVPHVPGLVVLGLRSLVADIGHVGSLGAAEAERMLGGVESLSRKANAGGIDAALVLDDPELIAVTLCLLLYSMAANPPASSDAGAVMRAWGEDISETFA